MEDQTLSSASIAKNILDRLISFTKDDTSSKVKSAIVALYSAQPQTSSVNEQQSKLRFSGQIVLLHLDYDRKLKNYFFRLYHLQNLSLVLELELYYGFVSFFVCHSSNPCLYYFPYLEKGLFAFLFKSIEESQQFAAKVIEVSPKLQTLQLTRQKFIEQQMKLKKKGSFLGRLKGLFQKDEVKQQQSKVIQIKKESGVLFDSEGNIVTENISPEWQQIIINSGLKKTDKNLCRTKSTIN